MSAVNYPQLRETVKQKAADWKTRRLAELESAHTHGFTVVLIHGEVVASCTLLSPLNGKWSRLYWQLCTGKVREPGPNHPWSPYRLNTAKEMGEALRKL